MTKNTTDVMSREGLKARWFEVTKRPFPEWNTVAAVDLTLEELALNVLFCMDQDHDNAQKALHAFESALQLAQHIGVQPSFTSLADYQFCVPS